MRRYVFAIAVIVFIALITFTNPGYGKGADVKTEGVLSVSDIQADPYAFTGMIKINGVVAGISKQNPKMFAVIETKEALVCKQTGCAKLYLPVRYEGESPREWDEVNVTGSFVFLKKKDVFGSFYFKADSIQNLGRAIK